MTDKEKEHYEKLAKYYDSKTKTYNEIFGKETQKYKVIVEYEYPCEHKPPVKADIYLHGDKVSTRKITVIENITAKIEAEKNKLNVEGELFYSKSEIKVFDKCLEFLKGKSDGSCMG